MDDAYLRILRDSTDQIVAPDPPDAPPDEPTPPDDFAACPVCGGMYVASATGVPIRYCRDCDLSIPEHVFRAMALLQAVERITAQRFEIHLVPEQHGARWIAVTSAGVFTGRCASPAIALCELARRLGEEGGDATK